jgi:fluoride exporter
VVRFLLICLGGAAGTGARHLISLWAGRAFGAAFPFGTLLVNVGGSFTLGLIMQIALTTSLIGPNARLILATGVMGGFTTYSTFNYETLEMLRTGSWLGAVVNVSVTVVGCLAAGALGIAAGRVIAD